MTSNASKLQDEDGDEPDWIELLNTGPESVDLTGWGLSDEVGEPFKWTFTNVTVGAGQYLVVFASEKNRRIYGGGACPTDWLTMLKDAAAGNPAGVWLFDEASGGSVLDSSGQGNNGVLYGGTRVQDEVIGSAIRFSRAASQYVEIAHSPSLQTTNSMTISMWLKPASFPGRQTVWNKAYGGEGSVTLETDGRLTYNWGTTGADAYPYQGFGSMQTIRTGVWSHVALVRDMEVGQLRWYLNGRKVSEATVQYVAAGASQSPLRLGSGFAGSYDGWMARPQLLPYAADRSLHANFRLNSSGEELLLSKPDGTLADQVSLIEAPRDVSCGRYPDGTGTWRYFSIPTPRDANETTAATELLAGAPSLSHHAGFYQSPFFLSMSYTDPAATILYTLDGSEPSPDNLTGTVYEYRNQYPASSSTNPLLTRTMRSQVYTGPIPVTDRSSKPYALASINPENSSSTVEPRTNIFKGTTVRARAYKTGAIPSRITTHTFFVNTNMYARYSLPVIALSSDEKNWFANETGIYVYGAYGNFWGRGNFWERPVHFEVFATNGLPVVSQEVGVRINGSGSRSFRLKGLRLYAHSREEEDSSLDYAFFPGLEKRNSPGTPLASFQRLLLRNAGSERAQSYYRDGLMQELVRHLPLDTQAYQPAVHFINGEYWGLINIRERHDAQSVAAHYDMDSDDVVILTGWGADLDTGRVGVCVRKVI